LARELEKNGHVFTSTGDTQVLLAAIAEWGLDEALRRAVGMFAFALWDASTRTLHLARDRMGEKPLHFGVSKGCLYFASELRAFTALEGFPATVSQETISAYFRFGYVPEPLSIYEGVYKLPPGTTLSVPASAKPSELHAWNAAGAPGRIAPSRYWSCGEVAARGREARFTSIDEASEELESRLRESV